MNTTQAPDVLTTEPLDPERAAQRQRNQAALDLLARLTADESGYDERTWPVVKQLIEENRLSERKRFSD